MSNDFVDIMIEDMRLDDPDLKPWDGESGGPRVTPGTYDFECISAERMTSKKGNPTLAVTYKVISDGEHLGTDVKQWYTLDPTKQGSRARLKQITGALGVQILDNGAFSTASMIGLQMTADVSIEQGQDEFDTRTNMPIAGKIYTRISHERAMGSDVVEEKAAPPPKTETKPANGATRKAAGATTTASAGQRR